MKKLNFIFSIFLLTLCACSQDEPKVLSGPLSDGPPRTQETRITVAQATQIANDVISSMRTRSSEEMTPSVNYLLQSSKTRSTNIPDTLAYVLNYPDNSGFAIISADSRVEPLLAYSDDGYLDISDEFVRDNILTPTEEFIASKLLSTRGDDIPLPERPGVELQYEIVEWMSPVINMSIGQGAPWNKKVEEVKGPGRVAGCAPVASVYIMTHCKPTFTFNGKYYNAAEIIKCIAINQGVTGLGTTTYSYSKAVDEISQLLLDFGVSAGALYIYHTDLKEFITSLDSKDACNKLMSSLFNSPSGYTEFPSYNKQVEDYLQEGCLVYIAGYAFRTDEDGTTKKFGHAWISDGYQKKRLKMNINKPNIGSGTISTYLHFNWGWDGQANGYFYGPTYEAGGYSLQCHHICAFKIQQ